MPRANNSLTHNLFPKTLALLAAVGLWAYANVQSSGQEALQATVRFHNVPAGLEVNPDQIESISVLLRGRHDRLRTLGAKGLVLSVSCDEVYGPGERTVNVDASSLNLPRSVEFVKATPSQLRFTLEQRSEKLVEVAPQFVGEIPPGYVLDGYRVDPPSLMIAGPADRVALIEQVSTDPISLAGEVGTRSFRTTAFLADPYLRFTSSAEVTVEVRMRSR
ncbi:MAG: YbbR-like domain-containing protein [Acidobacteria bacterium]|nr:YbbR-like domain-containing protein [Acidobacteriota bacterium]